MKNTKALKKIVILIIAIMAVGMLITPQTYAASNLQSNPTTGSKLQSKYSQIWMIPIREMEQGYANSGEREELNSDATSKTSNNIDVHFMKTSEYGAMAILSASEYGKGNKVVTTTKGDNSGSLTGNKTGVIIDTTVWEWTASTAGENFVSGIGTTDERYYDKYTTSARTYYKIGDGLVECANWHSAPSTRWTGNNYRGFLRGKGGLFSYDGDWNYRNSDHYFCARGVAVCGEGF